MVHLPFPYYLTTVDKFARNIPACSYRYWADAKCFFRQFCDICAVYVPYNRIAYLNIKNTVKWFVR